MSITGRFSPLYFHCIGNLNNCGFFKQLASKLYICSQHSETISATFSRVPRPLPGEPHPQTVDAPCDIIDTEVAEVMSVHQGHFAMTL